MRYRYILLPLLVTMAACNKQIEEIRPLTKITVEGQLATVAGLEAATVGNYVLLSNWSSLQQDLGEDRGNNVTLQTWAPPRAQTDAFFYQNSPAQLLGNSYSFYMASYQALLSANAVIEKTAAYDTAALAAADVDRYLYARGENLFIRALVNFSLVRVYGKPYYQDGAAGLSIGLKKTSDVRELPAPAPVKDIYASVISDLQEAARLMKAPVTKTNSFANTAAAWGLLSRVYLYMGGTTAAPDVAANQQAAAYADSVISFSGGKYALLQVQAYADMFGDDLAGTLKRSDPTPNKEIVFALNNQSTVYGSGIGVYYHYDRLYGVGAYFLPSSDLLSNFAAGDVRGTFFAMNAYSGFTETTKWLCLNTYMGTKAPTILFRLAEAYLNRAEALAKTGNYTAARVDLKAIHTRAGLPGTDIDALTDADLLAAILKERRLELAFEGHNSFDYFRNGLPMTRPAADFNGSAFTVQPDDPKVVFTIPTN